MNTTRNFLVGLYWKGGRDRQQGLREFYGRIMCGKCVYVIWGLELFPPMYP